MDLAPNLDSNNNDLQHEDFQLPTYNFITKNTFIDSTENDDDDDFVKEELKPSTTAPPVLGNDDFQVFGHFASAGACFANLLENETLRGAQDVASKEVRESLVGPDSTPDNTPSAQIRYGACTANGFETVMPGEQATGFYAVPPAYLAPGCVPFDPTCNFMPGTQAVFVDPFCGWLGGVMPPSMAMPQGMPNMMPPLGAAATGAQLAQASPVQAAAASGSGDATRPVQGSKTLEEHISIETGIHRIQWAVPETKVNSSNQQIVSPPFDVELNGHTSTFRMLIKPPAGHKESKGQSSMQKGKGRGRVEVKCEDERPPGVSSRATYQLSIGSNADSCQEPRKTTHDFALSACSSGPQVSPQNPAGNEWDFLKVLNAQKTFVVCLEFLLKESK